jgi:hypothetical protein
MSEQLPTPIANWPFWNLPFRKTARGYYCRQQLVYGPLMVFLVTLGLGLAVLAAPEPAMLARIVVPLLIAVWVFYFWFFIRPILPIVREAKKTHEPWRHEWLKFEQQSLAYQQMIRAENFRLEDAFDKAPVAPPCTYRMYNHIERLFAESAIRLDVPDAEALAIRKMDSSLSRMLCGLVQMGGKMVVGKLYGERTVRAVLLLDQGIQIWANFDFVRSGDALVPRFTVSVQEWSLRFTDENGRRYPGDLIRLKRHFFVQRLKDVFWLAIPFVGWLIALIPVIAAAWSVFSIDRRVQVRSELLPSAGDSADLAIMGMWKDSIKGADKWVFSTPQTLAMIAAVKERMMSVTYVSLPSR